MSLFKDLYEENTLTQIDNIMPIIKSFEYLESLKEMKLDADMFFFTKSIMMN
jgi:hypothetical protein